MPCAAASDGGGSIRIPASACGLFGLKASRGLVPLDLAHGEPLGGTATDGVLSRSVRDTARMLDVLAGPTDVSPYLPGGIPAGGVRCRVDRAPGRLRVGGHLRQQPSIRSRTQKRGCVHRAAALLGRARPRGVEVRMPVDDAELAQDFLTTWFVNCAVSVAEARAVSGADEDAFEPDTR